MIISRKMVGLESFKTEPLKVKSVLDPTALWFFAPEMNNNPYQRLLYSFFADQKIQTQGFRKIDDAVAAAIAAPTTVPRVLHLHWLNVVLAGATSDERAIARIEHFEQQLQAAKAAGVKIVWTSHNVLPHESFAQEFAIRIRKAMVESADLIHVMSPDTVEQCAPFFDIDPRKVVRGEHAGYHGFYQMPNDNKDLRGRWGLPQGGQLGLILGGIKPYKGLNEFSEYFINATANNPRRLTLVIAGKAARDFNDSQLCKLAEISPNLHVIPKLITDEQVASLMMMADFAAIPYRNSLNSGSLVLGLTFGKPILARASAGSTHLLEDGAGVIYDDDAQLADLLSDTSWIERTAPAAAEMSRRLDHTTVATAYARMARTFVDHGTEAAQSIIGNNGGLAL